MKRQLRIVTGLIAMLSILVGLTVVAYATEKHPYQIKTEDVGLDDEENLVDLDLWEYDLNPIQTFTLREEQKSEGISIRYTGPTIDGRILGAIPATINGEVTNLDGAFTDRTDLIYPPELPETAISMNNTFYGCSNLSVAPEIPESVASMNYTFANCTSMSRPPSTIPESVNYMYGTFQNCTSLTFGPKMIRWPLSFSSLFYGCSRLNLDLTDMPNLTTSIDYMSLFKAVANVRFSAADPIFAQYAAQNAGGSTYGPDSWTMVNKEDKGTVTLGETYNYTGSLGTSPYGWYGQYVGEEQINFTPSTDGEYRIVLTGNNMTAYFGEVDGSMDFLCYCFHTADITRTLTAGKTYQIKITGYSNTSNCAVEISSERTTPPAPPQEYIAGEEYSFAVKAENVTNFSNIVYKLEFDNTKFDIVNLCAGMYPAKTTTGTCSGQYIIIQSIDSTGVTFKCTRTVPAGKAYTGVINVIKLKAKTTGEAEVKVTTTNA